MEVRLEVEGPILLAGGSTPCPFGLIKELQSIHVILLRLDIPRGEVPIQLFLNILRGRALGSPLERQIKITELVKDVFGDRYGDLVPLSFHVLHRPQLGEDSRTKLSCASDCETCQIKQDDRLPDEMQRLKRALSKRVSWE
jgi:hypothetical protein